MSGKGTGDENFPVASLFLSAKARPHVLAFYAFARAADDVADSSALSQDEKLSVLKAMSDQLTKGDGKPHPKVFALYQSLKTTGIGETNAQDLLKAFRRDAKKPRTADWDDLMGYCELSAAPVGRQLIELEGAKPGFNYTANDALCAALQILNHIQDVKDDYLSIDRVYVPADWMGNLGVKESDLGAEKASPRVRLVLNHMLDGVDDLLDQACILPRQIKSKGLAREAAGILNIARALSTRLRSQDPVAGRVELSKPLMFLCFLWGAFVRKKPLKLSTTSSFYWALKILPVKKRKAMFSIYGFCRVVDDIADGTDIVSEKMSSLEKHRNSINELFEGNQPESPSILALKPVLENFALEKTDLLAVIDGMEMDVNDQVKIPDEATFDLYIDRVASAVGRLSNKVFGVSGPDADQLAYHLGRGLQITNILRDLDEDARRGRLYLPQDLLKHHGVEGNTPYDVLFHPNLESALKVLAARAHNHYNEASLAASRLGRRETLPARMMQATYSRVLSCLEKRGLARIETPIRLKKYTKLWVSIRYGVFG